MKKTSTIDEVISAWQGLNHSARGNAIRMMQSLVESARIEKELETEARGLTGQIDSLPGDDQFPSNHFVINGDIQNDHTIQKVIECGDGNIQLIFTSPPYNAGIQYDSCADNLSIDDYQKFLRNSLDQCDKALAPGGRLVINIRDIAISSGSRLPIIVPLYHFLCEVYRYNYRGVHIWYKGREESSTGWGSWKKSSNPSIIDLFEYVFVFQKAGRHADGEDNLDKMEFIENVIGVWKIRPVKKIFGSSRKNTYEHPCPFPVELARRIIKLYSHVGDTVLDPFCGVLNTAIAASDVGRNSVSVDISADYCASGYRRFNTINADLINTLETVTIKKMKV